MMIKRIVTICVFCFLFFTTSFASNQLLPNQVALKSKIERPLKKRTNPVERQWQHNQSSIPERLSFPTRAGFALMRKEDIISISIDPLTGSLRLKYLQRGELKNVLSPINLSKAAAFLTGFPFLKVSRSALINVNEIEQFEGTRRSANLLMSDGSKIKVSRQVAGPLHDWIKGLSA